MSDKTQKQINDERESLLDNKLDELAVKQNNDLMIDFDAAIEEEKKNTIKIKFGGKIYELPPKMPFSFSMFFFRNCFKQKGNKVLIEVPDHLTLEFIERMLGKDFHDDLLESKENFSFELIFKDLAYKILKMWGIDMESDEAQKKIAEMKKRTK